VTARYPLVELDPATLEHIAERGGRPINLYRALANQPALLGAWIDFASALRYQCGTPRALRELLILRIAQLCRSDYQWLQHVAPARAAGAGERIEALEGWRESPLFSPRERAALALAEAITGGDVDEPTHAAAAALFDPAELTELVVTSGFYCMVARTLNAMAVDAGGEPVV